MTLSPHGEGKYYKNKNLHFNFLIFFFYVKFVVVIRPLPVENPLPFPEKS